MFLINYLENNMKNKLINKLMYNSMQDFDQEGQIYKNKRDELTEMVLGAIR